MVIVIFTVKLRVKCWKEKYLRLKIEYFIIIHTYNRINYSIIIFYSTKNYRSLQFIMEITLLTNYINFVKIILIIFWGTQFCPHNSGDSFQDLSDLSENYIISYLSNTLRHVLVRTAPVFIRLSKCRTIKVDCTWKENAFQEFLG